ncbi:MAG: PhnD/SsuA/transferrin family substrate-binding protein [Azonexus sp.]|nr:PhnD/SsuA/transferrin family substrate-binding protein [Azonexus sp.]
MKTTGQSFLHSRCRQWLFLLCLSIATLGAIPAYGAEPVRIGILSFRPKAQMLAQWQPLAVALKQAIPDRDFVVDALSYPEMDLAVASRQLDFLITNPGHFVLLSRTIGLSAPLATLVMDESGERTTVFGGVIFSLAEHTEINTLADIKGKTVATTIAESLGSYQMQAYEFSRAGIRLPQDTKLLATGLPQDKVVDAVLSGKAEVGLVRTGMLEAMAREGKLDLNRIKIINRQNLPGFPVQASTRLYPEWPLVSLPHIDEELARQVVAALFMLKEDSALTQSMGIRGFAVPADYTPVADLLRELRMPPFEATPTFTVRDVWTQYRWPIVAGLLALGLILVLGVRLLLTRRELQSQHRTVLEQKRQLQESEKRFELAVEGAEEGIWDTDLVTGQMYHSPRMREMLGYTEQELPASNEAWEAIMHPEDLATLWKRITDHYKSPDHDYRNTVRMRHRDGSWRWILSRGRASRDANGRAIRFTGTHMDVTERMQAEAELTRHRDHLEELVGERTAALSIAKEAAESASRAKSTFLANMSHELRTPMNAIMGMTDLALRRATDTRQIDQLNKVTIASRHLLAVINDILDISKIEAERLRLEQIDFQLGSILENLRSLLGQTASEKALAFTVEIPDGLARQTLRGDPLRLGQILINLAGNAIKFTAAGSVAVHVLPSEETAHDLLLRIEVRDTGIGISAEDQKRLFTAFEQADGSTTRKYGGSGLGLAICRRLAQMMGGNIGVESQVGAGSTFWFTARLEKAAKPAGSMSEQPTASAEAQIRAHFTGTRVLLVEDEPINQEVSQGFLEEVGLRVDLAENGLEAVEMARDVDYALILMDMQMPRMNGIEATRAIRALPGREKTLILAMTANAFEEDRQRCLDAGMKDHIGKPVDPDQLFETLLKWLSQTK